MAISSVLAIGVGAPVAAAAASGGTSGWTLLDPPMPDYPNSNPDAMSCSSKNACTAFGTTFDAMNATQEMALRWSGSEWSPQQIWQRPGSGAPLPQALSCPTDTMCMEAGGTWLPTNSDPFLVARSNVWRSGSWQEVAVALPAGAKSSELTSVSCTRPTFCIATGSAGTQGIAERWDGQSWTMIPAASGQNGRPPWIESLVCISDNDCYGAGRLSDSSRLQTWRALVEHWNGRAWSIVFASTDSSSYLHSISCSSPNACTAVGRDGNGVGLIERWNGFAWLRETPSWADRAKYVVLNGVSCPTATVCEAVGSILGSAFAARWNGSSWQEQNAFAPAPGALYAVACVNESTCHALGAFGSRSPALALAKDGSWVSEKAVQPVGGSESRANSVACASVNECYEVGQGLHIRIASPGSTDFHRTPQAANWNGSQWASLPTPDPDTHRDSGLSGIAIVPSPGPAGIRAMAVGWVGKPDQFADGFSLGWDGEKWKQATIPGASTFGAFQPAGVACPGPSMCFAVGYDLISRWDGNTWSTQQAPSARPQRVVLSAITCWSPSNCTASGGYEWAYSSPGEYLPPKTIIEHWDGRSWSTVPSPTPDGKAERIELTGIACGGPASCVAVGSSDRPLILRWDGKSWAIEDMNLPAYSKLHLNSVSCASPTECRAVGSMPKAGIFVQAATIARTSAGWRGDSAETPPDLEVDLTGVACITTSTCMAAGVSWGVWIGRGVAAFESTGSFPRVHPTVTEISPVAGVPGGGNTITIIGRHLQPASSVRFGNQPGTNVKVDSSGTSLTVVVPAGAPGRVAVTVSTSSGSSAASGLSRYTYATPPRSQVDQPSSPLIGSGGQITGAAADQGALIAAVVVTLTPLQGGAAVNMVAGCTSGCGTQSATWAVYPSGLKGAYSVTASASNDAGMTGPSSAALTLVLNT